MTRGLDTVVPARRFGVIADGRTDVAGRLNEAIARVQWEGGGDIELEPCAPGKYYRALSPIQIINTKAEGEQRGVRLIGHGINTVIRVEHTGNGIEIEDPEGTNPSGVVLANFRLHDYEGAAAAGIVINKNASGLSPVGVELKHLWIHAFRAIGAIGLRVGRVGYNLDVEGVTFHDCYTGAQLGDLANLITFRRCRFLLFNRYGLAVLSSLAGWSNGGFSAQGCQFEGTRTAGRTALDPSIGIHVEHITGAVFLNNRFEGNSADSGTDPFTAISLGTNARYNALLVNYINANVDSIKIAASASGNFILMAPLADPTLAINDLSGSAVIIDPKTRPIFATGAGHTVDDVITTLQNIGLVRQT